MTFYFLYTTIPHSKLKDRFKELVQLCFMEKNDQRRYKYLVLGRDTSYFGSKASIFHQKVLWNWYYHNVQVFDWHPICYVWWTPFSNKQSTFLWVLIVSPFSPIYIKNDKRLARIFHFTFSYIDDVFSLINWAWWFCRSYLSHWSWCKGYQDKAWHAS